MYKWIALIVTSVIVGCAPKPHELPPTLPETQPEQGKTLDAELKIAKVCLEQGRVGEAAQHYSKALDIEPQNFEANLNYAISLLEIEETKFANERDYSEIRQHLEIACSIDPRDPRPHFYLGKIDFAQGDLRAAVRQLTQVIEIDPGNQEAHTMLGVSLSKLGRTSQAKAHLTAALKLDPSDELANFTLGKIYEKEGKNDPAMYHLRKALEANPNHDMALYILERVYYENGLYGHAERACKKFLEHHPRDIQSLEILGWIYRRQKRVPEMITTYEELTRLKPDNPNYWAPLIKYYTETQPERLTRELLERCLNHNPYYAYANLHYGRILMQDGDKRLQWGTPQEALKFYLEAREQFKKARFDERYQATAERLLNEINRRIEEISG